MQSVGSAAAQGILGGWEMMQQAQTAEDNRKQRAFENERQLTADAERRAQTTRENARQDKSDAEKETDRQIAAAQVGQAQGRDEFAQAAKANGGVGRIPKDVADRITGRLQKYTSMVNDLTMQRLKPYMDQKEQWAKDTMSRIASGQQINMPRDQLKEAIEIATGRPLSDNVRAQTNPDGTPGKSKVGQAIEDCTAALQTNNNPMLIKACSTLMEPDLRKNLGGVAPDGSTIVDKQLQALFPAYQNPAAANTPAPAQDGTQGVVGAASAMAAPQTDAVTPGPTPPAAAPGGPVANPQQQGAVASAVAPQPPSTMTPLPGTPAQQPGNAPAAAPGLQPHTDPNLVMPVLDVTTVHPADGETRTYHAPVTTDRQPGGPIAPPLKISDMMTRMGQLGVLEAWLNQPEQQDLRDMATKGPGDYMKVFLAAHGHVEDLRADVANYGKGTVGESAAAIEAYAKAHTGGDVMKARDELVKIGALKDPGPQGVEDAIRAHMAQNPGQSYADAAAEMHQAGSIKTAGGALNTKLATIAASTVLSPAEKERATKTALMGKQAGDDGVPLTPEALDMIAQAGLRDRSSLVGFARNSAKMTQISNRMAELAPGGDLAGTRASFAADKKSLEKLVPMQDAVQSFEQNTLQQGKVLVDLAKKVDSTGVPVIERWIRAGRKSVAGDADVSEFNLQLRTFKNEGAKILTNPNLTGVLTVEAQRDFDGLLPEGATAEQVERVVGRMEKDFKIREKSLADQSEAISKRMFNLVPPKGAVGGAIDSAHPVNSAGHASVAPADQAARDKDGARILDEEIAREQAAINTASDPESKARHQSDLASLQKERAKWPASATGLTTQPAAAPAVSTAAPKPAPTPVPAASVQPNERTKVNPQTGERIVLRGGQWLPVQK